MKLHRALRRLGDPAGVLVVVAVGLLLGGFYFFQALPPLDPKPDDPYAEEQAGVTFSTLASLTGWDTPWEAGYGADGVTARGAMSSLPDVALPEPSPQNPGAASVKFLTIQESSLRRGVSPAALVAPPESRTFASTVRRSFEPPPELVGAAAMLALSASPLSTGLWGAGGTLLWEDPPASPGPSPAAPSPGNENAVSGAGGSPARESGTTGDTDNSSSGSESPIATLNESLSGAPRPKFPLSSFQLLQSHASEIEELLPARGSASAVYSALLAKPSDAPPLVDVRDALPDIVISKSGEILPVPAPGPDRPEASGPRNDSALITAVVAPEPGPMLLLASGLFSLGVAGLLRRRRL